MRLPSTFQNRLILTYLAISLLVIIFLGIFVDWILEKESINHLRDSLVSQANLSAQLIEIAKIEKKDIEALDAIAKRIKPLNQCRVTIIAADGQVLGDSDEPKENIPQLENHLYRPEVKRAVAGQTGSSIRYSDTLKQNMLYVAIPLFQSQIANPKSKIVSPPSGAVIPLPSVVGILRLAVPLKTVAELKWSVRGVVLLGAVISLLLSLGIGVLIARSITKPIKEINRISAQYTAGEFGKKIYVDSVSEINQLADILNHMADQIQSKIGLIQKDKNETLAILNSMIEGVIAVGKNTRVISMNPAVSRIFEVNQEDGSGKLLIETIRNNELNDIAVQVLKTGQNLTKEIQILVPVEKIIEIMGSPLFTDQEIHGCVLIIHDVTQLRKLESVRKEFVENVSHELKTPLTSIKGYVETLLDGAIDDPANSRRFLQIIEQHTNRLARLVDDILQLSALDTKELPIEFQSVYLEPLLVEIMPIFSREVNRKNIQVAISIPEYLSPINANREKLKEVLINLLDNAVKFNVDNGKIEISAEQANREVTVTVSDTGIGIPEKDMPRIFERFYRVDKTRSRELGGTGLGLAIVKHIIEQHNGTITVTSEVGKGTQFRFTLPKR
ncbi:MAG: two-component system histidine kinase PnpS [bacterium]